MGKGTRASPRSGAAASPSSRRQAPDRDEVNSLIRDYRRTKEAALRDRLIAQHLYLVQTAARKFAGLGESHEDLLQEGAMGLINAVDLYDPDRGVQFSTYATHLVEGQIRHYLRDRGKLIKQPAWVQELTTRIVKAGDALTQQLNRPPTPEEIAELVGTSPENVRRMLEARERSKVASLDAARSEEDDQSPAIDPEKLRTDDQDGLHLPIEDRIFLRDSMSRLKTLERKVVHNFYYLDLNQTEIARKLGISVNYASYLLRGAIAKLKKAFEAQEHASTTNEGAWQVASSAGWQLAASRFAQNGAAAKAELSPAESVTGSRCGSEAPAPQAESGAYSLSSRPAASDPVTKLATEAHLNERVEQEVARASRYPQQFSVVLVEPDGDDVEREKLVELARLLRGNCRSIDLVARMSGCRFGLLLPHTGREASILSERICRTVAARLSTPEDQLTVSSGFAVFPTNGRTAADIFAAAHRALLEAKGQGGNRALRAQPVGRAKGQAQPATS